MRVPLTVDTTPLTVDTTGITADAATRLRSDPGSLCARADSVGPSIDGDGPTADADCAPATPCSVLPDDPPSVVDRQAIATADDLYPQIAGILTPRGPAWGTDEAGDGRGAGPVMRGVWRAIAAWAAAANRTEFELATQALPSALTWSLPDWEAEYGLPDPCYRAPSGTAARIAAVRARFAAQGGASPHYFICLAAAIGYRITIDEPDQFMVDVSAVVGDSITETWFRIDEGEIEGDPLEGFVLNPDVETADEVADETVWKYWIVNVVTVGETWFRIDEGEIDTDPLEGFTTASDLECLLRRYAPEHTALVFSYTLG